MTPPSAQGQRSNPPGRPFRSRPRRWCRDRVQRHPWRVDRHVSRSSYQMSSAMRPAVDRGVGSRHMSTENPDSIRASPAQFRLVTRYASRSAEAADDNQRRVEAVFAELAETRPDNVTYLVLRLADDSFVHISFHGHGHDETNPIASTDA